MARLGSGIGRPTKFSWAWAERFLAALRAGHFRSTAATLTGKNPRTVAWWIKAGTLGGGGDLTRFVQRVETAEAQAEAAAVAVIARETAVDPALAIRFLRLRYPERFPPRRSP